MWTTARVVSVLSLSCVVTLGTLAVGCSEHEIPNPASPSAIAVPPDGLGAKPAPPVTYPAQVTFADGGNAVRSDGGGSYVNGGRLEVVFYAASKDLVMRGGSRSLTLDHANPIGGIGPAGITTVSDIFMNIRGILDIPNGESRSNVVAVFKRTSTTFFRFNPANFGGTDYVTASRAGLVWTVTAPAGTDIAALAKDDNVLGTYNMPFQMTVVCDTCPLLP